MSELDVADVTGVTEQSSQTGGGDDYENFIKACPLYKNINLKLISLSNIASCKRIVDLGCGTGFVSEAIINRLESFKDVYIYAVDTSRSMLDVTARRLSKFKDKVNIRYIHGDVLESPEKIDTEVDAIIYCNSIHYVSKKEELMRKAANLLRPGGIFTANSSFISESHDTEVVGSEAARFYFTMMLKAIKWLKVNHKMSPLKSVVESRRRLSANQYIELAESAGFSVKHSDIDIQQADYNCWSHFVKFRDFVEGALPGIPFNIGYKALLNAITDIMSGENKKMSYVNRGWLQLVAVKT